MESQQPEKRIKLFLERSIERLPFDITQKAEEIYLPDGDPAEKLKRKIKTIADAAGDNYDQFTDNVVSSQEAGQQQQEGDTVALAKDKDSSTVAEEKDAEAMVAPSAPPAASAVANTRVTSPQGIYAKLWHAQSEIGMALDVLNIIIASYQVPAGATGSAGIVTSLPNPNTPLTALPPGSLKCEYVPRTPLPVSTQIANEKLALGGKKHHLRNASDILMQGAQKLKKVMADEDQFWAGALRLRKNNWCIVSGKPGSGHHHHHHHQGSHHQHHHHHGNRLASGSHLFVHYGFRDVGSLYGERAYAELVRNQTAASDTGVTGKAKSIELHIPNKTGKVLIMSLVQQGAPHIQEPRKGSKYRDKRTLHCQLLEAQDTLIDGELFHELINEARTMGHSISIVNNEIFLPINDELELKIAYRAPTPEDRATTSLLSPPSPPSLSSSPSLAATTATLSSSPHSFAAGPKCLEGTAHILQCAMHLLLHRRHRQNIRERSDSFFKSSRPGGGRTAGSFGQIQQTLQQRPSTMLSMTLQVLQYYSFSRRIREVVDRITRHLKQSWWESISVHSVDVKLPPSSANPLSRQSAATTTMPSYGMGSAVSIRMGSQAPAVRFVMRSHPAPGVVFQLPDRPSAPIMHVAEFERVLEQEMVDRAMGRICEVVNSIESWIDSLPGFQSPKFVIDIERRCIGVFQIPPHSGVVGTRTAKM
ncbi:RNA polymerase II mediator complex subunit [Mortierella polycephala]|uniref:Mediator of RNA polymerase II transcription subunit 17 n=1 Tax=Mortierella polycephala TaxID=41804 RepID=A0A9P6PSS9_9FUNG|nr:RNA polymerase II mediator complex subunit [Mortierella polycephala]